MTIIGVIEMQGIRAIGRHGVLPEEQKRAQPFEIDVRMTLDVTRAAETDQLEDTVDYGLLSEAIARTVELQHYALLERLADHIGRVCLHAGPIQAVEVTVRKLRPPISIHIGSVAVSIIKHAEPPADLASADVGVDADPSDEVVEELDQPGAGDVGPIG